MRRRYGWGDFIYEEAENWAKVPEGTICNNVPGAFADRNDKIYVLTRGNMPVMEFTKDGEYICGWGQGIFRNPHSMYADTEEGKIYVADDGDHTVRVFDTEHRLLMTLGTKDLPSDTGIVKPKAYETVKYPGGPFNSPTGIALDRDKNIYVSDGYGNCVIHKFTPDGRLIRNWGMPGHGPGEFMLPHHVMIDQDTVYVCDRQNHRVQLFDTDGNFKCAWPGYYRPATMLHVGGYYFVVENVRNNLYNGAPNRASILKKDGTVISRIEGEQYYYDEGVHARTDGVHYRTTHGMAVDSDLSIYLCDVGQSPKDYVGIHKFVRVK